MKNNKSIKFKAAILLTVFALNTIVAFACSLGLEMGFNQKNHHDENEEQVSSKHSDHHSKSILEEHHEHNAGIAHHDEKKGTTDNNGCCNDQAIKIQQVDKSLRQGADTVIKAPVFVAFLSAFLGLEIESSNLYILHKSIVPQYYPPPDIRIAIQSFQI